MFARIWVNMIGRIWVNMIGRTGGPMSFRLILQPGVAIFFAIRGKISDAQARLEPHALAILTDPTKRRELLRESWQDVAMVFSRCCDHRLDLPGYGASVVLSGGSADCRDLPGAAAVFAAEGSGKPDRAELATLQRNVMMSHGVLCGDLT
jgi:hypothetical protein